MDQPSSITGIVLAGGRSSRFGSDKMAVDYRGRPLLFHAIDPGRGAHSAHHARAGGFHIHVEDKCEVRPAIAEPRRPSGFVYSSTTLGSMRG